MNANGTAKILLFSLVLVILLASAAHPVTAFDSGIPATAPAQAANGGGTFDAVRNSALRLASEALAPDAPCGGGECRPPAGDWHNVAPLPAATHSLAVVSDGVYIYAAGGSVNSNASTQLLRYDPVANTWKSLAPMPNGVIGPLGIYALGKIYILGGEDSSSVSQNLAQVYTISTNTWSTVAPMPGIRHQAAGGYYNGKLFVVGGYTSSSTSSVQQQTWAYTIGTNSWATLANMPGKVAGAGSGVVGNLLYVMGGRNDVATALNSNYAFNLNTLAWATKANLPTAVNAPGSVVYRKQIWLFGGGTPFLADAGLDPQSENAVATTQIYDTATNTWLSGPNQATARSFQGDAVVRNRIVSVGGRAGVTSTAVEMAVQDPLKVLILFADNAIYARPESLQTALQAEMGVGQVDLFDAHAAVAPVAQLSYYDLVVAFSNEAWNDNVAQGNNLATYVDLGGVVVALPYDWFTGFYALAGNWGTGGYSPFASGGDIAWRTSVLGSYVTGDPLMAGVTELNGHYRLSANPVAGANLVAYWDDSFPLVAIKGNVVAVNAYIGNDYNPKGWSGDFSALIANAGYLLRKATTACVSLTCPRATVINGSITAGDPTMTARLGRYDPGSTCAASKLCPGSIAGTTNYDTYYFYNNSGAQQCVSVTADASACGTGSYIGVAAYSQFNPANICTNYLADIGASPEPIAGQTKAFSFNVPPFSNYTLVVNQAYGALCPAYKLTVVAGACPLVNYYIPKVKK